MPAGRTALLAAAVLVGQLSVGWANDAIDSARDQAVGRTDKPLATGELRPAVAMGAARLALGADVPLSLAVGWRAGAAHLVAVGWAWLYDARLKAGVFSVVPFLVSFGLLPLVVAAALPGAPAVRPLLVVAGAACGAAAHFANTVGDAADDAATGVRGLPQRVGERGSVLVAAVAVALAAALLPIAAGATAATIACAVGATAAAVLTGIALRTASGRRVAFRLVLLAVGFLIVGFIVAGGHRLTTS